MSTMNNDSRKSIEDKSIGNHRWIILFVSFFFLSFLHAGFISYNCGFVAMTDLTTSPLYDEFAANLSSVDWSSDSLPLADRRFDFSTAEKGWSFGGGFAGAMFSAPLLNWLSARFGMHRTMTVMGSLIAATAFALPFLVSISFPFFVVLRFITGSVLAILYSASGDIVARWAPQSERGLWIAVLSGHVEFSPLFSMPHAGIVGSHVSWPAIYFSHGTLATLITILWTFLYRDEPQDSKLIKVRELEKILEGKQSNVGAHQKSAPLLRMATTPAVIGVWIASVGYYFAIQFSITFSIIYFAGALNFTPIKCGLVTMIPLFVLLLLKLLSGRLSDYLTGFREVTRMRAFNSAAFFGSAVCFLIASFRQPDGSLWDIVVAVLPICALGFHSAGFPKCSVIIARQYSPIVFSYMQVFGCAALVTGSFLVPVLVPSGTHSEWTLVFKLYALVLIVTNILFCLLASDAPCKWTYGSEARIAPLDGIENPAASDTKSEDGSV